MVSFFAEQDSLGWKSNYVFILFAKRPRAIYIKLNNLLQKNTLTKIREKSKFLFVYGCLLPRASTNDMPRAELGAAFGTMDDHRSRDDVVVAARKTPMQNKRPRRP
jgi:hypothetical protein